MRVYILGSEDAKKQQSPAIVADLINKALEDPTTFPNGSEIIIRNGHYVKDS